MLKVAIRHHAVRVLIAIARDIRAAAMTCSGWAPFPGRANRGLVARDAGRWYQENMSFVMLAYQASA